MDKSTGSNYDSKLVEHYFHLWTLLGRARDAIYRAREVNLRKFGITPEQLLVIIVIKDLALAGIPATPSEIARRTFRTPATISISASRMMLKGLIKRSAKRKNSNKKLLELSLTKLGEDMFRQLRQREITTKIMSSLSKEQEEQLVSCMKTLIVAAVNEIGQKEYEKVVQSVLTEKD